jgi:hypothetical protein
MIAMNSILAKKTTENENGATMIFTAICIFMLIAFTALAVDISHLVVTRNELQNAADAGALAGARFLYTINGSAVNTGANQIAIDASVANLSDNSAVEVLSGEVERGHWSFIAKTFTPNETATDPVDLWDVPWQTLDANPNFINAIRVRTRRQSTPVQSFFAKIFGRQGFQQTAVAVAYIGFAGTLQPLEADTPIVICKEALTNGGGPYTCSVGRMINSGSNTQTHQTGGWTDFNQDNPCNGGTNASTMKDLVESSCPGGGANPEPIVYGKDIATNGGQIQSAFDRFYNCFHGRTDNSQPLSMILPVVTCPSNNVGTCENVVGAVQVEVVWVSGAGDDPSYSNAPTQMELWSNSDPDGAARWQSFVNHFNLQNVDGSPAPYAKKSIYFKPSCEYAEPTGVSGGENFGVLAKIPVLVD